MMRSARGAAAPFSAETYVASPEDPATASAGGGDHESGPAIQSWTVPRPESLRQSDARSADQPPPTRKRLEVRLFVASTAALK